VRFVVYGAGAIGGVLGARLHQSGREVLLVARGAHYEAIRSDGLRLVTPDGAVARLEIPVVDRIGAARVESGDIVALAMKSQDTEAALRELADAAPTDTAVACVQNGVENERAAIRLFANVYGVLVLCPAAHLTPGVVEVAAAPESGILDVGRVPHGGDDVATELVQALRAATYLSEVRDDVMPWKYTKLLMNLGNALVALAGADATGSPFAALLREEGEAVLRAAGIAFVAHEEFRARSEQLARELSGRLGNSTLQSVRRGSGSIETDYLNGEIVALARRHGVPAPANELVQRLARRRLKDSGAIGSVPLEEIERELAACT
jgi:2-dehydropantoate 2-reductase